MATKDTVVQELVINTLTHEQFKAAQKAGTLSPYELYGTPDTSADRDLMNTTDNVDIVIESQFPTAENNYTWYRKYKSGWVEQGGVSTTANDTFLTISLPIAMSDTNYVVQKTCITNNSATLGNISFRTFAVATKTTTSFQTFANALSTNGFNWQVSGMAA